MIDLGSYSRPEPGSEGFKQALTYFSALLGLEEALELLKALEKPPSKYFLRVNTLLAEPEEVVKQIESLGFKADVYGAELPEAVYIEVEEQELRDAEAQGLKVVVVDRFAAESVMMGADLYLPGIKRIEKVAKGDLVAIRAEDGSLAGIGVTVIDSYDALRKRRGLAVKVLKTKFKVPSLRSTKLYQLGLIYPQSLPSMKAVRALEPRPGWRLIDLTAAPGGKVSHAYQLMKGEGVVIAVDRSKRKVQELKETLERLRIKNVIVLQRDSRYLDLELPQESFNAVIVDPPCSALGVRPKLKVDFDKKAVESYANYQRQFLKVAANLVRRGGRVLYSTCTLTKEENEDVVSYAERELRFTVAEHRWLQGSPSLLEGRGAVYARRFYPHLHDTPGFFYVVLEKQG